EPPPCPLLIRASIRAIRARSVNDGTTQAAAGPQEAGPRGHVRVHPQRPDVHPAAIQVDQVRHHPAAAQAARDGLRVHAARGVGGRGRPGRDRRHGYRGVRGHEPGLDGALRGGVGGILGLLDLIEEHRDAFDYDWRTRFGLSTDVIGTEMDLREAWSLTRTLISDGTSRIGAAVAGWDRPWSPEAWALADIWDLLAQAYSKRKLQPYPRPNAPKPTRFGKATLPQHHIRAALAARGHR